MKNTVCIIGTGTEIGKTYVCCQILDYLAKEGKHVAGIKPVATGEILTEHGYLNEDAYHLYSSSNIDYSLKDCNPICFGPAIAPHIAAKRVGMKLDAKGIAAQTYQSIQELNYDHLLIEGVGGLMVPLNDQETYLDLLVELRLPVIMVVGIKLGCLNNALLTEKCLTLHQMNLIGWIANYIDPNMEASLENTEFLSQKLRAPLLATINYQEQLNPNENFFKVFI